MKKKILFTSHGCYEHSWLYKVLWVVRLVLSVSDKTAVQKWLIQRIAVKERRSNAHFHFLIKQITFRFHWHAGGHTSFAWHFFCCKCIRSLSNRQSLITKHINTIVHNIISDLFLDLNYVGGLLESFEIIIQTQTLRVIEFVSKWSKSQSLNWRQTIDHKNK